MFGLPLETIVVVGGAFIFITTLLFLWGLYFKGDK